MLIINQTELALETVVTLSVTTVFCQGDSQRWLTRAGHAAQWIRVCQHAQTLGLIPSTEKTNKNKQRGLTAESCLPAVSL